MNRRHLAMVGAATVVVLLAWFALLWSPRGADLAEAREQRATAEQQESSLRARLTKLQQAKGRGPALQALAGRVRSAVPTTPDLDGFLLATDDAAVQAHVSLQSFVPSVVQASPSGGPNEIPVNLTVKGPYVEVGGFLDRLLDLPRVAVVDSISVSADAVGAHPSLTVSLTGRIFTAAPIGTTPSTTAPAAVAAPTPAPAAAAAPTGSMVP